VDIGTEIERVTVEPLEDPVPREDPAPAETPTEVEPECEPIPAGNLLTHARWAGESAVERKRSSQARPRGLSGMYRQLESRTDSVLSRAREGVRRRPKTRSRLDRPSVGTILVIKPDSVPDDHDWQCPICTESGQPCGELVPRRSGERRVTWKAV
jgi:hypothetical protein